jgi:formate hydrogenlyase subunit 3/multisubunit Na+/H+ antiporter MnhD subunit
MLKIRPPKTGIRYLVQMHIGMFFLLMAFLIAGKETGTVGFDAVGTYFHRIRILACSFCSSLDLE